MVDETWPTDLPPFVVDYFALGHATAVYQTPFTPSTPQRVRRAAGELWRARYRFDRLDEACMGKIEALVARLQGQLGAVLVVNFRKQTPINGLLYPSGVAPEGAERPFRDTGLYFDTGYGWGVNLAADAAYFGDGVTVRVAAAMGAASILMKGFEPKARVLEPGDVFGLPGGRMHIVTNASGVTATRQGFATVNFRPPLRAAVDDDDVVTLRDPACRMRLLQDIAPIGNDRFRNQSDTTLDFIEDPT